MLEIRSILEGVENFNSPTLQEFAGYVASRLPKEESYGPLAQQATDLANEIMFASLDIKGQPTIQKQYPHLRDYIKSGGDMQILCSEVSEVLIDKCNTHFSVAFASIKPRYFG